MTDTDSGTETVRELLNTLTPNCVVVDAATNQECGEPAAWIVTWFHRFTGQRLTREPWCVAHYGGLIQHRMRCPFCVSVYDVQAVEL